MIQELLAEARRKGALCDYDCYEVHLLDRVEEGYEPFKQLTDVGNFMRQWGSSMELSDRQWNTPLPPGPYIGIVHLDGAALVAIKRD